ncbi:hypothetical protein FRC03_003280 [Tulasnella sp. 419]|nr:hypothetical protein FRC03_003280 [Tulasnella sp. 419]
MPSLFKRSHLHDEEDQDNDIDDDLRLRTVRTAHSTLAESIRTENRRTARRRKTRKWHAKGLFKSKAAAAEPPPPDHDLPQPTEPQGASSLKQLKPGRRRNIYVNCPLPPDERRPNGDPIVTYYRNKVKTTKYSIITFLPKNLYEQFRRVANMFFLILVIIQVWPIFGAAAPQVAMLPLVVIVGATAVKDGVEDYRRAQLDDEVNNSAATKLGGWRNVNQLSDPRMWFEKLLGIGERPDKVSKGVRKLREKEASEGKNFVLVKEGMSANDQPIPNNDSASEPGAIGRPRSLEDIQSVASRSSHDHSYPPAAYDSLGTSASAIQAASLEQPNYNQTFASSTSSWAMSNRTGVSAGVVDWQKRTSGTAHWERTLWKKLGVGDIVLLRDNDQIPADIVVLSTSDADGLCYVETKNLDGETNLKPRRSLKATSSITSDEDLEHASFVLDSEPPHANLYTYSGVLRYRVRNTDGDESGSDSGRDKVEPVTINELLLRGCAVRNTQWIIGLVVFTGQDTKIMLNGGDTPSKRSKIEKETNFNVITNFILLVVMTIVTGIVNGYYNGKAGTSRQVYEKDAGVTDSNALNAVVTAVSCLIAFQNIVPIALYISIEIVKTIQAYFINQDVDMYYEPYDTCCVPKTWNISDDLGQIEYIFSDKTGTLTQNIMEFQKCSINGVIYGEGVTEAMRGQAKREGRTDILSPVEQAKQLEQLKETMIQKMSRTFKNRYLRPERLTLISPQLADDLADRSKPQRGNIISFFRALSVCHSVLPDKPEPQEKPFTVDYKAESPDEAALVAAARDVGFPFVHRNNAAIDIEVMGQAERYIPLKVLEFNSTRKRMSVVVRNPEGKIVLYCKGADSVIYARLAADHDQELKAATSRDMEKFANGGLRTLCIAYRYLTEQEYFDWSRQYDAAAAAVADRDEEIEKASELVEHSLYILGATALEDKLQEGVPEAIDLLHKAGIKLWILTGDKLQTAIEIGFSCNLLKNDMEIMILSADSMDAARAQVEAGINKIASILGPPTRDELARQELNVPANTKRSFAVVIDGDTLRYALDPTLKEMFLNLGTQCDTVVCCRVSPAQKALTVKLVKEGRNAMTLSIGDGANDVAMIQEANIGCGLIGLEGSQAAMSADYAFGQFRFLTKLLLVHGRWSYQRVADMHGNFFYKNVIWTFAMFWYLFWNSFDATYLYQYTFIILFNLAFTALPVIVMGAFDQDINAKASLAYPQLYKRGILGLEYTKTMFWLYMFDGFYQSAVVFFIPFAVWSSGYVMSWNGRTLDSLADFGTTASVAAIWTANLYVGLNTSYWTWIMWFVTIGSNIFLIIWIALYSSFESIDFIDEFQNLMGTVDFWAMVFLCITVAIAPRFILKFAQQAYIPLDKHIVREMWVMGDLKDRLGIGHRKVHSENRSFFTRSRNTSENDVELDNRGPYRQTERTSPSDIPENSQRGVHTPPEMRLNDSTGPLHVTSSNHPSSGPSGLHPNRMSYYSPSDIPSPDPTGSRSQTSSLHVRDDTAHSRASDKTFVTANEWEDEHYDPDRR